jgi:hypothetical protein
MLRKWSVLLMLIFGLCATSVSCSIIKRPPAKSVDVAYKDLPCTEQDRNNIYEIISNMAEKGKLNLLFQQSHLRELGAQINHVHPLTLLSVIFTNAYLKSCMFYIWGDYFKRNNFIDGLAPALTREAEKGKLSIYLEDFAKDLGIPAETLKTYFDSRDWENMVFFLVHS